MYNHSQQHVQKHAKYTMHKEPRPLYVVTTEHHGMLCQSRPSRTLFQRTWGACLLTSSQVTSYREQLLFGKRNEMSIIQTSDINMEI